MDPAARGNPDGRVHRSPVRHRLPVRGVGPARRPPRPELGATHELVDCASYDRLGGAGMGGLLATHRPGRFAGPDRASAAVAQSNGWSGVRPGRGWFRGRSLVRAAAELRRGANRDLVPSGRLGPGDCRRGLRRFWRAGARPVGRAAAVCIWLDPGRRGDPAGAGERAVTPAYQAIGVLVLGAVVLLLLVGRVSGQPRAAGLIGLPFAIVAAGLGLQAPQPLSLAVA